MNREILKNSLETRGFSVSEEQLDQLFDLMKTTLETNEKFNLTAIKEESAFLEKMIFDSALALVGNDFTDKEVLDFGTGAGFPGLVMYILNPNIKLTLLDSTKKKIDYLANYCTDHNYKIKCVCARGEDFARKNIEKYDVVTARAVSELSILLEITMPMLKVGGALCALKSSGIEDEILRANSAFHKLDCKIEKIYEDNLPESDDYRAIVSVKKLKKTQKKYPRDYATIKDKPL